LPPITSSMRVDITEERILEIEFMFSVVVQKAKAKGVPVPILEIINALLMGINGRIAQKQTVNGVH